MINNSNLITKKCGDSICNNTFQVIYKLRNKVKLCTTCSSGTSRIRRYRLRQNTGGFVNAL